TIDPEVFKGRLFQSTSAMIFNSVPGRTTLQAFLDDFSEAVPLPDDAMERFEDFYARVFPRLGHWGRPSPGGRELIEAGLEPARRAADASALFLSEPAIRVRLRCGGVAALPCAFVSSSDKMPRSKPFREYFLEISERIGVRPDQCLMVGD